MSNIKDPDAVGKARQAWEDAKFDRDRPIPQAQDDARREREQDEADRDDDEYEAKPLNDKYNVNHANKLSEARIGRYAAFDLLLVPVSHFRSQ
jgi:hypothetical protein